MAGGNSYNGWPANSDPAAIGVVQNAWFPGGVKAGDVTTVLGYVARQLDARVEPIVAGWCWGWSYRANVNDPSSLSCHASGTAIDWNSPDHPNGSSGTFTAAQVGEIYAILDEVAGTVDWLESYDEMHFEIAADPATLARVAATLPGAGTDPAPTPSPEEDGDMYQLVKADSGNGALFAYAPGRFIHVESAAHLDIGSRAGLWDPDSELVVSQGDLDMLRDNSCGNGAGKGDNLIDTLPSTVAGG